MAIVRPRPIGQSTNPVFYFTGPGGMAICPLEMAEKDHFCHVSGKHDLQASQYVEKDVDGRPFYKVLQTGLFWFNFKPKIMTIDWVGTDSVGILWDGQAREIPMHAAVWHQDCERVKADYLRLLYPTQMDIVRWKNRNV
jgi:hypothetical protein